jgi:hypothetical protein
MAGHLENWSRLEVQRIYRNPFCRVCPGIHSDGVIFHHDNARQQETLLARKTAVNFSVGKHNVIPQTVRTSHLAI